MRAVFRLEPEDVPLAELLARTKRFHAEGFRLATATCVDRGDHLDVLYHFDRDLDLQTIRVSVPEGGSVPSLTPIYLCAFLVENEMFELFGLKVEGMAVDFGGGLLLSVDAPRMPMRKTAAPAAE